MLDLSALFDEYERVLLISSAVVRFSVLKRRVLERGGYLRVRAELVDGGLFEISEFWHEADDGQISRSEYSFHWQARSGQLVWRWDNVKHHQELSSAPHHAHTAEGRGESIESPPDLETVLREIEEHLGIHS
jgi:hypothetical protein